MDNNDVESNQTEELKVLTAYEIWQTFSQEEKDEFKLGV